MYDLIYDFIITHFFSNNDLQSYEMNIFSSTINMSEWLSHTLTIISMCLFFTFLVIFIKWVFKVVSGLIMLR